MKFNILILCALVMFSACSKDDENTDINYNVPTTYDFENVSYSGQEQRIGQLAELTTYMKSANVANTALDVERLKGMYTNDEALANWNGSYEASKQIKGKTFEQVQGVFETLLEELAATSQPGSTGGVVTSANGEKNYLLNENGVEYAQVISKGLMGALLYYQATAVYFGEDKMNLDNITVTAGRGTEMEHAWDEAFGYFGVPQTFPSDTEPLYFWGDYCHDRDAVMGTDKLVMDAFLKGRAAVSNNDLPTRDEAIEEAREAWEKVIVGTALHYLNGALTDFEDAALKGHQLSEAAGFLYSLQFNPSKKISNAQIGELLTKVGGSDDLTDLNINAVTAANVAEARDALAEYYDLEELKEQL